MNQTNTEIVYSEPPITRPVISHHITHIQRDEPSIEKIIRGYGYKRGYVVTREDEKVYLILVPGDEIEVPHA